MFKKWVQYKYFLFKHRQMLREIQEKMVEEKAMELIIRSQKGGLILMKGDYDTFLYKVDKKKSTNFIVKLLMQILKFYKVSFDEVKLREAIIDYDKKIFRD